jgi:hypothetical protein
MKSNVYRNLPGFLTIMICFSCSNFHNDHNISINISESSHKYRLSAYYNRAKDEKVHRYINECIQPARLTDDYVNATTTLDDNTIFYIRSTSGELSIKLDKRENSEASYRRVKKICEGIKEVLKDNN